MVVGLEIPSHQHPLDRLERRFLNYAAMKILPLKQDDIRQSRTELGDVLYAGSRPSPPEQIWLVLVQSIAGGDQQALHTLYAMAHRIVFTLVLRITANRESAEELTVDVFHAIWRDAARHDPARGTVLAWIMNQARS